MKLVKFESLGNINDLGCERTFEVEAGCHVLGGAVLQQQVFQRLLPPPARSQHHRP